MLIQNLQSQLSALYETPLEHCVADFLVTDAKLARLLQHGMSTRENSERLLLVESEGCLDISLYIDETVLNALADRDPYVCLSRENLNDFLIALEGVSHFNYVLWNARHEKSVTQFELELQAEVDKFVTACALFALQGERDAMEAFHGALFDDVRFDDALDTHEEARYRDANRYAAKYCSTLTRRFRHRHDEQSFVKELRRFYRLSRNDKVRCIEMRGA